MINMWTLRKVIILIAIITVGIGGYKIWIKSSNNFVRAFGPLKVTFPSTPMFRETDWFPGKVVTKSVTIENTDNLSHLVAVKAINKFNNGNSNLREALTIIISQNGQPIYGLGSPKGLKRLSDFYNEESVDLFSLNMHQQKSFDITIMMDESVGDDLQGQSTSFDLLAGVETSGLSKFPTIPPVPTIRTIPTIPSFPTLRLRTSP